MFSLPLIDDCHVHYVGICRRGGGALLEEPPVCLLTLSSSTERQQGYLPRLWARSEVECVEALKIVFKTCMCVDWSHVCCVSDVLSLSTSISQVSPVASSWRWSSPPTITMFSLSLIVDCRVHFCWNLSCPSISYIIIAVLVVGLPSVLILVVVLFARLFKSDT